MTSNTTNARTPKPCFCGCGDMTKGGDFCMGHDARFKSGLMRAVCLNQGFSALQDFTPEQALQFIKDRGWEKHLEKYRANLDAEKKPRKAKKGAGRNGRVAVNGAASGEGADDVEGSQEEIDPVQRIRNLETMKEAYKKLQSLGLGHGPNKIEVNRDNMGAILSASEADLRSWHESYPLSSIV